MSLLALAHCLALTAVVLFRRLLSGQYSAYKLLDATGWLAAYKIPRLQSQRPTPGLMRATFVQAGFGHTVIQLPMLAGLYHAMTAYGMDFDAPLPSTGTVYLQVSSCVAPWPIRAVGVPVAVVRTTVRCVGCGRARQILFAMLFLDCWFYWSHRALHHPLLYKRVHKQHHEYLGTVSVAAEYALWGSGFSQRTMHIETGVFLSQASSFVLCS